MQKNEKIIQILDLIVTISFFVLGCILGKMCLEYYGDSWLSFNLPALGVFLIGEMLWCIVRKQLFRMIEKKKHT